MLRATFLVDGFNVYHSLRAASRDLDMDGSGTRWLDLKSLFRVLAPNIETGLDVPVRLSEIYYFSALPNHMEPATRLRHATYLRCLENSGIHVEMGHFKKKFVWCETCETRTKHWEEKETDVAISVRLAELALRGKCDVAVLVTGDTDLAPAVRMVRRLAPELKLVFAFPYKRKNKELDGLADFSLNISKENYLHNQFPDPLVVTNNKTISKPPGW